MGGLILQKLNFGDCMKSKNADKNKIDDNLNIQDQETNNDDITLDIRDISQLKEIEKQLKRREEFMKKTEQKIWEDKKEITKQRKEMEEEFKDKENKLNIEINKKLSIKIKEIDKKEEKLNKDFVEKEKKLKKEEEDLKLKIINLKAAEDIFKEEKRKNDKEKENINKEKDAIRLEKENIRKERENIKKEKSPILVGLDNIGATCYMNATLQSLSNTDKLTDYFFSKFSYEPENKEKKISNEYYKLLINLHDAKKMNKSYSPNNFKTILSQENPLFEGIQANDSKDLINFLIERLHKELNIIQTKNNDNNNYNINQLNENEVLQFFLQDFKNNYRSIISDLFYGVLETKTKCSGCQNIKYNFQIFSFVEFPLEQVNIYCYQKGQRNFINNNGKNPDIDIYECFDYYHKVDLMTGDNKMYCNLCNCLQDALYSTSLYSTPEYFIINLNRGKNAVYECKVIFPELLNILNFVTSKDGISVYKLYAVICHYGPSSMSGHFMAYCRNSKDNKWYLYNDSIVSPCTKEKQYCDGMPYILFYKSVK